MLTVDVEFLHGAVRAAGADDATLTGRATRGEWPPSPARLYAAFVAADGSRDQCRLPGSDAALHLLEAAPEIQCIPNRDVLANPQLPRFVPRDKGAESAVQNYPARQAQLVRPGVRLALRDARVRYRWRESTPNAEELAALEYRAARIGYLGCSDSPVKVTVRAGDDVEHVELPTWVPDDKGREVVSVVYPGYRELLDDQFDAWTSGKPRRRAWMHAELVAYRGPDDRSEAPRPQAIWVRFDRPIDGRRVVLVAETLRAAALEKLEDLLGSRDAIPAAVHGHRGIGERGYEHVRWLPLPHAACRHADGRLRGACVWLPAGTDAEVVGALEEAVARVRRLVRRPVFDVGVAPFDGVRVPWTSNPRRWRGQSNGRSKSWVSVTPVVQERFVKRGLTLDDVKRWCQYAQLPEPVAARWSPVPLVAGCPRLEPRDLGRANRSGHPYGYLELRFAEELEGPLAVGRGRHFGLGLMAPIDETRDG